VTLGTTLVVFGAAGSGFVRHQSSVPATDIERVSERVEYVIPQAPVPPVPPVPSSRQRLRSSARPVSALAVPSPTRESLTTSLVDTTQPPPKPAPSLHPNPTPASERPAPTSTTPSARPGAPAASATVGLTRVSKPVRFDSVLRAVTDSLGVALTTGAIEPPPLTQAERDVKWREEAFEVVAARGAGRLYLRKREGGGFPIGLPFGGPSRKQRERDRAIEAQLKVIRAQRRARIDSVVAARRRLADLLLRAADPLRVDSLSPPR